MIVTNIILRYFQINKWIEQVIIIVHQAKNPYIDKYYHIYSMFPKEKLSHFSTYSWSCQAFVSKDDAVHADVDENGEH